MNRKTKIRLAVSMVASLVALAGLAACTADGSSAQSQAQAVTNDYSTASQQAVPYPLKAMKTGGWTERRLDTEHLIRENDPNAVRYVYLMTPTTQLVASWTIRGMVFDPNTQLTNTQTVASCGNSQGPCGTTVDAPGDNGTWGPEAFCYAFFTTSSVEIQLPCNGLVPIESDAPLSIATQPVITYSVNAAPSINHGGLAGIGGK